MAIARYQVVLQNNHFAGNIKQDKTEKGHKIRIIGDLNESFQAVFSNEPEQCINEYMMFLFLALRSSSFTTDMDGVDIMDQITAAHRLGIKKQLLTESIVKASIVFT